jgi:nitrogen regulatory protein PII
MEKRKLLTIIAEALLEEPLTAELEELGVPGYTITEARGKGRHGVRNSGWEHSANILMEIVCEEELARAILAMLEEKFFENYAIVVFLSDVEVLHPEKFRALPPKRPRHGA